MSLQPPKDQAQLIVEVIACSRALMGPINIKYDCHAKRDATEPDNSKYASALDVFSQAQLEEMTNIFGLFSGTCLDPNHIKACACVNSASHPRILVSINQGSYGEGGRELQRSADMIENVCRCLGKIGSGCKMNTRNEILTIIAHAAWPRISHHFGAVSRPYCHDDDINGHGSATTSDNHTPRNGDKVVKVPVFLPDKLGDLLSARGSVDSDLAKAISDLEKQLRTIFGVPSPSLPRHKTLDVPSTTTKERTEREQRPDGTGVPDECKVAALMAVYDFYQKHKGRLSDLLSSVRPAKRDAKTVWINRFKSLCMYVEGVNYLCNLALGYLQPGQPMASSQNAGRRENSRIIEWFQSVKVTMHMLPKEAFLWNGKPASFGHAGPVSQTACPRERSPDPPMSPALSTASSSIPGDRRLEPPPGLEPTMTGLLKLMKLHNGGYEEWLARQPPPSSKPLSKRRPGNNSKPLIRTEEDEQKDYRSSCNSGLGLGGGPPPKIHAEIPLVLELEDLRKRVEEDGGSAAPAYYIASSKKACYSCDHFMQICGTHIIPSQSHAAVYPAWRLPDDRYIREHVPTAAEWPRLFCARLWDNIRGALFDRESWSKSAPQKDAEDIGLRTMAVWGDQAYGTDHWTDPLPSKTLSENGPSRTGGEDRSASVLACKDRNRKISTSGRSPKRPSQTAKTGGSSTGGKRKKVN